MKEVLIKDIIETLESVAPLEWQEDYDNSGLTLGDKNKECSGVYVCLDISLEVVEKAIENKCNLIISHHPIIFGGIKKIDYYSTLGKIIVRAIKNERVFGHILLGSKNCCQWFYRIAAFCFKTNCTIGYLAILVWLGS